MARYFYQGLHRVISGGQTGSDQAGLFTAQAFGLETGGFIPRGFKTIFGNDPELAQFGLIETTSEAYPPRTKKNVETSGATVRLASNFETAGEVITLRYCQALKKPNLSILLDGLNYEEKAEQLVEFLKLNAVRTLNVAGTADRDTVYGFHFHEASSILTRVFIRMKNQGLLVSSR
jgi:hypothetical protein